MGYRGEERRGEPSFGRRSDDTAHPSRWQVPAVAPLQRTQTNRERERAALHCVNTTDSGCWERD